MSASLWYRSVALLGALGLGLIGSSFGASGCLAPDYCIVIATEGTDWCAPMTGALMWPEGQPELAEPVQSDLPDSESPPRGCVCMNDGEQELLLSAQPPAAFAELVDEVRDAARADCQALVPQGFSHNCLEVGETLVDGVVIPAPGFDSVEAGESNPACIGSCTYALDPPFGEPCGEPDPWECNGEDPPGTGETGGDESGGETGATPFEDGRIPQ